MPRVQVSRYYRAPEIILGNERGQPLDVWSIGCCLYEMFTGDILFKRNKDNNGLLYEIMKVTTLFFSAIAIHVCWLQVNRAITV